MSHSLVVCLSATVVLVAALGVGGGARALQFGPAPAGPVQTSPASGAATEVRQARGPGEAAERDVPACGLRKVWVATDVGPRLKWRRPCAAD